MSGGAGPSEGGLNDGAAFPFVLLELGLIGLRWPALRFTGGRWSCCGRARHQEAVGLDVFLGLGLVGLSYGLAQLCGASGFLAVFASGLPSNA
jgi:sodium/hydrogen antiporter